MEPMQHEVEFAQAHAADFVLLIDLVSVGNWPRALRLADKLNADFSAALNAAIAK